jgi:hypothetical protein
VPVNCCKPEVNFDIHIFMQMHYVKHPHNIKIEWYLGQNLYYVPLLELFRNANSHKSLSSPVLTRPNIKISKINERTLVKPS